MVSNWEPAHSLVEDAVSGAEIAPCLPALAVVSLPLCLWQGGGDGEGWGGEAVCSPLALLWYSLNPLFCEPVGLCVSLEPFVGNFPFLFLSGYATVWDAISR